MFIHCYVVFICFFTLVDESAIKMPVFDQKEKAADLILTEAMSVYVRLLVFLGVASTVYGDCPRPTGKDHMQLTTVVNFPVPDGTSVTFTCDVGYSRKGIGTITCTNGQWSSLNMICEKKSCGSAGEVINGHVDYSEGTDFGAVIRVICNDGYSPVPIDNSLYCGASGWQGRLSLCEPITCYPPAGITNGYYSPVKDTYQHSEVVTYYCNGEYKVNGSKILVCRNEVFSPAVPNCVLVNCETPKVNFGRIESGSRPPYTIDTSVTFSCNTGYRMNGTSTVSCDINSKWQPALPNCTEIQCKAPQIPNAEVVGQAKDLYKHLDVLELTCTEGHKLEGESRLTCVDQLKWSAALPTCTFIECAAPEVEGGKVVGQMSPSYKYKDTVEFVCDSGRNMTGQSTVTCDQNGQWSPKLPVCTLIQCKAPEVKHGRLVEGWRSSYTYKDTVVFDCESGNEMKGANTVTCGKNSQWSPELPECIPSHSNSVVIGVSTVLAIIAAIGCGACIYFGVLKKNKRSGKTYTEAPKEADMVALS